MQTFIAIKGLLDSFIVLDNSKDGEKPGVVSFKPIEAIELIFDKEKHGEIFEK